MGDDAAQSSLTVALTEKDFVGPLEELIKGHGTQAAAALVGIVATVYGGPLAGAVASGVVQQIARRATDTVTTRFLDAGKAWDSDHERLQAMAQFFVHEVAPQFARLSDLLAGASQQDRALLLTLAAQNDEQFEKLFLFIHRTLASRESQAELLRGQQEHQKQLQELIALLGSVPAIEVSQGNRSVPFEASGRILHETIELERQFFEVSSRTDEGDPEQMMSIARALHRSQPWSEVLKHRYAVVLGEAGTGKSTEFRRQSAALRAANRWSFFVDLSDLLRDRLEDHAPLLESWRRSGEEAVFFLDSLDEAKLHQGTLHRALKMLYRAVGGGWGCIRLVVSCRASDWQAGADEAALRSVIPAESTESVYVVQLGPLEQHQFKAMAEHMGVKDVPVFCQAVVDRHAQIFVERPLDVRWLATYWKQHSQIAGLTELLEDNIRAKLDDRADRSPSFPFTKAQQGARALAGIATLKQRHSFLVQDDSLKAHDGALAVDARNDVLPDWPRAEISELLRLPIFDESTYGRVRFHHRFVREFLTAQWLRDLVENGLAQSTLEDILLRENAGKRIAPLHLAPVVSWLCIWNPSLREKVIRETPSLLLAHGDPAQLSPADRCRVLRSCAENYVDRARQFENFDHASLERFASPDLAETVRVLLSEPFLKDEFAETLLALVEHGRILPCATQALSMATDQNASVHVRAAAVAAAATAGTAEHRDQLRSLVVAIIACPPELTAAFIRALYPETLSVADLLILLAATQPPPHNVIGGLSMVLDHEISLAGDPEIRLALLEALVPFVSSDDHGALEINPDRDWLLPLVGNLLASVLEDSAQPELLSASIAKALELVKESNQNGRHMRLDLRAVDAAMSRHKLLRRTLFWQRAADHRERTGLMPSRYHELRFRASLCNISVADVEWLANDARDRVDVRDRLLAFDALTSITQGDEVHLALVQDLTAGDPVLRRRFDRMLNRAAFDRPAMVSYELSDRVRKLKQTRVHDANRKFLTEKIEDIRSGAHFGLLWFLLTHSGDPGSSWSEISVEPLRKMYGDHVVRAARSGWSKFWRTFDPPLPHEQNSRGPIPNGVVLGLVGLAAEVRDGLDVTTLDQTNTIRAIRYAASEANGFPEWLVGIAKAKPEIVEQTLAGTIVADYEYDEQGASPYGVLAKLPYAASEVQQACFPVLRRLLESKDPPKVDALSKALAVVLARGHATLSDGLFERRCVSTSSAPQPFAIWWASWLQRDATSAMNFLEQHTTLIPFQTGYELMLEICAQLDLSAEGLLTYETSIRRDRDTLCRLIPLVYTYICPTADVEQCDDYSGDRDRAQHLRSRLLRWLEAIPGRETVQALRTLADDPRLAEHRDWLLHVGNQRRVVDAGGETPTATNSLIRLFQERGLGAMRCLAAVSGQVSPIAEPL